MPYTTSDLLTSVKRNAAVTSSNFRFSDTDILSIADEVISTVILPMIIRLKSERMLYTEYATITADVQEYQIPYRAVGSQLREITLVDNTTAPTRKKDLTWVSFEAGENDFTTGVPVGYYFKGDKLLLAPTPEATEDYLKITYPIRHGRLVTTTATATISSVDYNTGVVTLSSNIPSSFTTLLKYDFICANSYAKASLLEKDLVATVATGSSMTFTAADLPTGLVSGDKVCISDQTSVILLPDECYQYVCKAIELKLYEAQGDYEAVKVAMETEKRVRQAMEIVLTPRTTGDNQVVINRHGLLNRRVSTSTRTRIV